MYPCRVQRVSLSRLCVALGCLLLGCTAEAPDYFEIPRPRFDVPVPYAVAGERLGIWNGHEYAPIFIKGVNMGVAVPGTQAGELAATREQYRTWLEQLGEMGVNVMRIYTLHYPRFYEEVARYNSAHQDKPIYLLLGAWLDEENPTGDFFDMTELFEENIREAVDCAHGDCNIPQRQGRAFGRYRADISQWILGWIVGREIAPDEVAMTNGLHGEHTSYKGTALSLDQGSPIEAWFVERMDYMILRERERYGVERPMSVSSWPTLDPLNHPSEDVGSYEDDETLDLANIDTSGAPAGYFVSYHAYPYYPDFITRDARYQDATDSEGSNTYFGYLHDLRAHYGNMPVLIAEFGVPTSWGNAHYGADGMNHGGQTEIQQGLQAARLLRDTYDAGCAGGAFFAWIDEWWKRTWIVDELSMPVSRYKLWHNVTSPEQNFGLIAFDLGEPNFERWPAVHGDGRVRTIEADVSAEFFFVRVTLKHALADGEILSVAFDTYGDDLGESLLPSGVSTTHRNEFVLRITAPSKAQLYVTRAYDLFGIWHGVSTPEQLFHSVPSDSGDWVTVRWRNNATPRPGIPNPNNIDEVGRFVVRRADETPGTREGVVMNGSQIEVRVPWTLLQFTDPSTLSVMNDDRGTADRETTISEGVGIGAEINGELLETARFRWDRWERAPQTTERAKASLKLFADAVKALPD